MPDLNTTYRNAYGFQNAAIEIGHVLRDSEAQRDLPVRIPLAMMNRHGLIAGSTGTGKTKRGESGCALGHAAGDAGIFGMLKGK